MFARVVAFVSILIGGVAGGMIGYAFADLGGFDGALRGLFAVAGALVGAGGVAVVAVLTLRAFGEWQTVRDPSAAATGRGATGTGRSRTGTGQDDAPDTRR